MGDSNDTVAADGFGVLPGGIRVGRCVEQFAGCLGAYAAGNLPAVVRELMARPGTVKLRVYGHTPAGRVLGWVSRDNWILHGPAAAPESSHWSIGEFLADGARSIVDDCEDEEPERWDGMS